MHTIFRLYYVFFKWLLRFGLLGVWNLSCDWHFGFSILIRLLLQILFSILDFNWWMLISAFGKTSLTEIIVLLHCAFVSDSYYRHYFTRNTFYVLVNVTSFFALRILTLRLSFRLSIVVGFQMRNHLRMELFMKWWNHWIYLRLH